MRITRTPIARITARDPRILTGRRTFRSRVPSLVKQGRLSIRGDQDIQDIGDHTAQDKRRDQAP